MGRPSSPPTRWPSIFAFAVLQRKEPIAGEGGLVAQVPARGRLSSSGGKQMAKIREVPWVGGRFEGIGKWNWVRKLGRE